jgi:hypothetical protein
LVRQLITSDTLANEAWLDTRGNRTVPVEIGVLALGYTLDGQVSHLLPPRPPLSLDEIFLCTPEEIAEFTSAGRMGYLRHVLRDQDKPVEELLAAHLKQVREVQDSAGNAAWLEAALEEVITLLKDDYAALMRVLGAVDELEQVPDRQSNLTGRLG